MNKKEKYYQILGVAPTSSIKEIRDSFRQLLTNHPEKNNLSKESIKKFQEVQESFEQITDYNKDNSLFPTDKNKLTRFKVLVNKLNELDAKEEEENNKKRERERERELLRSRINGKELEELKVAFSKIYKNGPSAIKYKYFELGEMYGILELIKDKEPNKKLDNVYQGYADELENKVLKPLAPLKAKASWWFSSAENFDKRLAATTKNDNLLLDVQNALEKIEKIRYLSPIEKNELKRIKEFDKNEDLTPLEIELDKENEDENPKEVDISNSNKQDLITLIARIKQEIQALRIKSDKTLEEQEKLTKKEEKLQNMEKELEKFETPSSNNNFPTGWVIAGGVVLVIGLFIVGLVVKKRIKNSIR